MVTELVSLKSVLELLVTGGLAGSVVYWLLAAFPVVSTWYDGLDSVVKRAIAFLLSGLLAMLAWLVGIGMGYYATPLPEVKAWIEAIVNVIITAGTLTFSVSQAWHMREL